MKNFLQYSFTDYKSDSAFCNQRNGSPELFDCLFIYSHKVPSAKFYIEYLTNPAGELTYGLALLIILLLLKSLAFSTYKQIGLNTGSC